MIKGPQREAGPGVGAARGQGRGAASSKKERESEAKKGNTPGGSRQTAKGRLTRALSKIKNYCRETINRPLKEQWEGLKRRTQGHYQYYGIRGNSKAIGRFAYEVRRAWLKSLRRRSGHHAQQWTWERFNRMLEQKPLPKPRIRMATA